MTRPILTCVIAFSFLFLLNNLKIDSNVVYNILSYYDFKAKLEKKYNHVAKLK